MRNCNLGFGGTGTLACRVLESPSRNSCLLAIGIISVCTVLCLAGAAFSQPVAIDVGQNHHHMYGLALHLLDRLYCRMQQLVLGWYKFAAGLRNQTESNYLVGLLQF